MAGKGLGQEDDVGVIGLHLADEPRPEGDRLGVRVVDPEDPDSTLDPGQDDLAPRLPQLGPDPLIGGPEVERVDVLVALRRVFGVPDRAIGGMPEPFGVLAHPGVVG